MKKSSRGGVEDVLSKSKLNQILYNQIDKALRPFGITPSPALAGSIAEYLAVLLRWNQKVKLTAIADPQQILERHFGESLFARSLIPEEKGLLVDVGSGAGFPGLALKLVLPGWRVQLFEPNTKKATFLAEVVRRLELTDLTIRNERMEKHALGSPPYSLSADVITARALGEYEVLLDWSKVRLSPVGRVILWVGGAEVERLRRNQEWSWQELIAIPLSKDRFLLVGSPKV